MRIICFIMIIWIVQKPLDATSQTFIPRIGATVSTTTLSYPGTKITPRGGASLSAGYDHDLTKNTSLQVELSLIQNSYQTNFSDYYSVTVGTDTYFVQQQTKNNFSLWYLELPLLIKIKLNDRLAFFTGPAIGIAAGGKYHSVDQTKSSYLDPTYTVTDGKIIFKTRNGSTTNDYYVDNNIRTSLQTGVAVDLYKGILVDLRYGFAFTNLLKTKNSKISYLQLSVGYKIQKVKRLKFR